MEATTDNTKRNPHLRGDEVVPARLEVGNRTVYFHWHKPTNPHLVMMSFSHPTPIDPDENGNRTKHISTLSVDDCTRLIHSLRVVRQLLIDSYPEERDIHGRPVNHGPGPRPRPSVPSGGRVGP
jgi:hypothetical protein